MASKESFYKWENVLISLWWLPFSSFLDFKFDCKWKWVELRVEAISSLNYCIGVSTIDLGVHSLIQLPQLILEEKNCVRTSVEPLFLAEKGLMLY